MATIKEAQDNVFSTYKDLSPIIEDIVDKHVKKMDSLIRQVSRRIDTIEDEEIRKTMMSLAVEAYTLSEIKEHSSIKAEISTALMKESQARTFNTTQGTQGFRQNTSIADTLSEQTVSIVYNGISKLLASKLYECHKFIDTLNSVLISRASEAKINKTVGV